MSIGGGAANTTSLLRLINQRAVFTEIFRLGKASRPELARITGLSKPTISMALADLERAGLVRPVGLRSGGAGRAALLYEIRPEAGWVLAADIGRTTVRLALADLVGEIVVRRQEPSRAWSYDGVREQLTRLVGEVAAEADHVARALAGVVAVLDPELIVLGGGIGAQAGDLLAGPVAERLETLVALTPPRIEVSTLGQDAVILGALAVGLSTARDLVFERAVAAGPA